MKKFYLIFIITLLLFIGSYAQALSIYQPETEFIESYEVPIHDVIFIFYEIAIVIMAVVSSLVFWVIMLYDSIKNRLTYGKAWIVALIISLLLGIWPIMTVVYYLVTRRKSIKSAPPAVSHN